MRNGLNKTTLDQLHSAFVKFPALEMGIFFNADLCGIVPLAGRRRIAKIPTATFHVKI